MFLLLLHVNDYALHFYQLLLPASVISFCNFRFLKVIISFWTYLAGAFDF